MNKIEAFEIELQNLGCILIEVDEYSTDGLINLAKDDTDSFLKIIKTFSGETIVFDTIADSMYYMVIFHGYKIELEVAFEESGKGAKE